MKRQKSNKRSTSWDTKEVPSALLRNNPKKEVWNQSNGYTSITLNASQQVLHDKINDNTLVFVEGKAGTGKTLSILYTFVKEYLKDNRKQIMIIRTPVEAGMDKIGALPNDYNAKIEPHFDSTKRLLEKLLSKGKVEADLNTRIHFKIPNFALGATYDNTLVLCDEVQAIPPMILKLLLERIGENTKMVIAGDSSQIYSDRAGLRNALSDAIPRFFTKLNSNEVIPKFDDMDYHEFTVEDVMRSDIVKDVIRAYS